MLGPAWAGLDFLFILNGPEEASVGVETGIVVRESPLITLVY
jgi:hypothetical protein